mmetsp:Transcript_1814/g.6467  ORF Transcript_1814/g.6467 Transcript_1814/m.6467 type:complete len:473 (-) Transcript_1814:1854-3272(-)
MSSGAIEAPPGESSFTPKDKAEMRDLVSSLDKLSQPVPVKWQMIGFFNKATRYAKAGLPSMASLEMQNVGSQLQNFPDEYALPLAERCLRKAVDFAKRPAKGFDSELWQHYFVHANKELCNSLSRLAVAEIKRRKLEEAEAHYVAASKSVEDLDVHFVVQTHVHLASFHRQHSKNDTKWQDTMKRLMRILTQMEDTEELVPHTWSHTLAHALWTNEKLQRRLVRGKTDKALELLEQKLMPLCVRLRELGEESPLIPPLPQHLQVSVLNEIRAKMFVKRGGAGDVQEAEKIEKEILKEKMKRWEDSKGTPAEKAMCIEAAHKQFSIGDIHARRGNIAAAEGYFKKAGEMLMSSNVPDRQRDAAYALYQAAVCIARNRGAMSRPRLAEAAKMLDDVIRIYGKIYGEESMKIGEPLLWLAQVRWDEGNIEESEKTLQRALHIGQQHSKDNQQHSDFTKKVITRLIACRKHKAAAQ